MATSDATLAYVMDQISAAGDVTARKMFGEVGIYCDGKFTALICDDQLFIKPTVEGRAFAGDIGEGTPYPGAKPHLLVPGDRLEDADWVAELVKTTAAALPAPKPKKR